MGTRSDSRIELLYDDGPVFQDCLAAIRAVREIGKCPTSVRMNSNTARGILEQSEFVFEKGARVFIRIADLPVKLSASLQDNYILLGYEAGA